MTGKIHIWPEERVTENGCVTVAAILEPPKGERVRLWHRVPEEHGADLIQSCDPLAVGFVFSMMRLGQDSIIHGQVSPALLGNLAEYQAAWSCWRPGEYTRVEITADTEREPPAPTHPGEGVLAFSGGVDSAFSAWRHSSQRRHRAHLAGRQSSHFPAGVLIHGFDIPLHDSATFTQAAGQAQQMLSSLGMGYIPVATNYRDLGGRWRDTNGAGLASLLMLFGGRYGCGLIGSTETYRTLGWSKGVPHASNPITDWLLSTKTFTIIHDGASFSRAQKIQALADWPEALQYLRVCWDPTPLHLNCGKCRKCTRTILEFRAAGLPLPASFERDINNFQIVTITGGSEVIFLREIVEAAQANGVSGSWVWALYIRWWFSRLRLWGKHLLGMRD